MVWKISYLHNLSVSDTWDNAPTWAVTGSLECEWWLLPSPLVLFLPTSERSVMGRWKARESLLSLLRSHHLQPPPSVTCEVEQFCFIWRKYNIFVIKKFFLHRWPVHRANINVIKQWNRREVFSWTKQSRIRLSYGKKKWLLHCSLITNDGYCDEVKWVKSPFGKGEGNTVRLRK